MKIAFVSPRYAPFVGGVETQVAQLAVRMARHGWVVEVLTQRHERGSAALERRDGVLIRRFVVPLPSRHYALAPSLWSYVRRYGSRYDLVHALNYHAVSSLATACSPCRKMVFSPHYHGTGHSPLRGLLHVPYRIPGASIFRRASHVICDSAAEATLVHRDFALDPSRVTVVPLGVDRDALRAALPYPHDGIVILSAGRLERYKNVHLLIRALPELDARFVVRIIGEGPARGELEALAARLDLQARVRFLGRVPDADLRRWFRTAAVFVSMSSHEAFGITLLEAVAAGTAAVVADIPAFREVARDSDAQAVTLLPLDAAPAALAQAVRMRAATIGTAGSACRVASWDEVAARTMAIYRTVAGAD